MSSIPTPPLSDKATVVASQKSNSRTYRIKKYLGRGGFGITYLAESDIYDGNIPQKGLYTIKEFCLSDLCTRLADGTISVSSAERSEFEESKKSFINEALRLQKMKHEGIVPVNEVFEANGTAYYVMQYLGETSLVDYVAYAGGKLAEDEACQIVLKLCDALAYLHSCNVTHLDVKPANVMMVNHDGGSPVPVLIDFGLACHYKPDGKRTNRHVATGTSDGYSPLEQYAGIERFSPEADVYALAATLFYMLKGQSPVKASKMSEAYLSEQLKGLHLRDTTLKALKQALQQMTNLRTASVSDFANQLKGYDPNETERGGNKKKTTNWSYMVYIGGALLLIASTFFITRQCGNHPPKPTEDNHHETTDTTIGHSRDSTIEVITDSVQDIESVKEKEKDNTVSAGIKNFGYAIYKGQLYKNQPNGHGRLTFKTRHQIESSDPNGNIAEEGEYVEGDFSNGHLLQGTWHKNDGTTEYLMIGGI